jgi:hypothetical protein
VRPDPNSSNEQWEGVNLLKRNGHLTVISFGYRDLISQPQLEGLDPAPKGKYEPPLVPPG